MDTQSETLERPNDVIIRPASGKSSDRRQELHESEEIQPIIDVSLRYLEQVKPDGQLSQQDIDAAISSIHLLQTDTLSEYTTMIKAYKEITNYFGSHSDLLEEMAGKQTLFLLLSNTFNRGDELIESATAKKGTKISARAMLQGVFTKGLSAFVRTQEGSKRVPPTEMIQICKKFAGHEGIDTSLWDKEIQTILATQQAGMEEVERINAGHPTWNVDNAIDYRRNTVGRYGRILGSVFFDDEKNQQEIFKRFMLIQIGDDRTDMLQDHGTQINPYETVLRDHNEWETFVSGYKQQPEGIKQSNYIFNFLSSRGYYKKIRNDMMKPLVD